MQKLEKVLEEIGVKISGSMGRKREGLLEAEEIIRKHMNDGWISVEEQLPEGNKTVLVCQRGGAIDVAWHDGYRWKTGFSHADWLSNVIAWRPLPAPYREE